MRITASPDTNHSVDMNTSHIEQKQTWKSEFDKSLDTINSKLALDWLKLELPKTKEQEEKEVLELVKKVWLKESFDENIYDKWVYIKKVQKWVFTVVPNDTWNVNYFVNEKWEIIFWVFTIKEEFFISNWKAFEEAWYIEKNENWKYNLYQITKEWLKWPIDINSKEYYKAWTDIIFYNDLLVKFVELKDSIKNTKEQLQIFIEWWSFKIEDLELFRDKWMIDNETFAYWVSELRKVLLSQCNDTRLITLTWFKWESLWIKESNLKTYLKKWYIDDKLALECFKVLPKEMKDLSK